MQSIKLQVWLVKTMSVASCPPLKIEIVNHMEEVSNALHKG